MSSATYGTRVRPRAAGLTPPGAVLVALGGALAGALADGLTGSGLRTLFAIGFVAGAALAAFRVRLSGLRVAVVAPPLVYALVALSSALFGGADGPRTPVTEAMALFTELIVGAPVLVTGTVAALVVALVRHSAAQR